MDTFTKAQRSALMSRVRREHTQPELIVRKILHAQGFRFRLHRASLPGRPDIVLPKYQVAIFVQGCFWHGHDQCRRSALPKSNQEFWAKKIERNRKRDLAARKTLKRAGWRVLWIWECETRRLPRLSKRISKFLSANANTSPRR